MAYDFVPFELERIMSIWENQVEVNLSESGVHPMTLGELVDDPVLLEELMATELTYPQTNGTIELREAVAAMYPGATAENVLITTGCAQANFTGLVTLLSPGDEMAMLMPNYQQIWGIARNLQLKLNTFSLKEETGWGVDIEELNRAVTDKTKLIAVCNPNNPTGYIMSEVEMDAIVAAADRVGAWLLADEVYAGAERVQEEKTPSFWGRYDKVLAHASTSKAYGLPGLRVGWSVTTPELAADMWARQDYITISNTMLGNKLAAYALSEEVRPRIMARARKYIRTGYANLEEWIASHDDVFTMVPPQAAAIAFVRYQQDVGSIELIDRAIAEERVYMVPGSHFSGLDKHLRISFGLPKDYLFDGLDRLYRILSQY
ncbi:MAG: aminotransferase class I/II-fold pyridoxal phosphate-dependent enzyme [Anaerolineaceae bacterium]|jgi:aspartate/methionine/tyrosine aminotransferase|nr:aminotransferase class I/II-fold pyridoxal phosphate-dependent enzyme [Anaerolineaceae bacterium]